MSYPTPPCAECGHPVYLTVSGVWRHVERDYAHPASPERPEPEGRDHVQSNGFSSSASGEP